MNCRLTGHYCSARAGFAIQGAVPVAELPPHTSAGLNVSQHRD
jgi:hypothetical protein